MARTAFIKKFGKRLTDDSLGDMARELFEKYDEDGSGAIDAQELQRALVDWEVEISADDIQQMILEAMDEGDDGDGARLPVTAGCAGGGRGGHVQPRHHGRRSC